MPASKKKRLPEKGSLVFIAIHFKQLQNIRVPA